MSLEVDRAVREVRGAAGAGLTALLVFLGLVFLGCAGLFAGLLALYALFD